jgi:hypothetical protein
MEKLYRIEELNTSGWDLVEEDARKLTKEQASQKLNEYIQQGLNPNRLRAVPDND